MRFLRYYFALAWLLGGAVTSTQASPSVVLLDSGEQLIGEVLPESTNETLVLRSSILGELKLPLKRIVSIQTKSLSATIPAPAAVQTKPVPAPATKEMAQAKPPAATASQQAMAAEQAEAAAVEEGKILDTLKEFKAPEDWSGNLRLGINLSQGDNKWAENYMRGKLEIDPQQSPDFYRFSGSYTYRQTERVGGESFVSTNKYDAEFIYRRTFREDWFFQNALGYRVDEVKGIQREAQETVGIGYRFKPSDKLDILFGGGGGVEEFEAEFEDTRSGLNPVANVFQEATWRPLKRTSIVQKFNYYWNPSDAEQFNYILSAAVRVRLTDLLGLEFSFNRSFDNDVGNGNAQDDTQWRNALVVYF